MFAYEMAICLAIIALTAVMVNDLLFKGKLTLPHEESSHRPVFPFWTEKNGKNGVRESLDIPGKRIYTKKSGKNSEERGARMESSITSRQNPLVQRMRKLLRSRSFRQESGLFAAEGTKLLGEAARWCQGLDTVLCTPDVTLPELPTGVIVHQVSRELLEYVSTMDTPQGVVFSCRIPVLPERPAEAGMLLLDGIQDPGNLGTILRTADALRVPVLLTDGCADPYNPKTVRAAMGALFRSVPAFRTKRDILQDCEAGLSLAVTAMSSDAQDLRTADLSRYCVVIGSEGQGVCREFLEAAAAKLIIPMRAECESLNAAIAAAIVMWQMRV